MGTLGLTLPNRGVLLGAITPDELLALEMFPKFLPADFE